MFDRLSDAKKEMLSAAAQLKTAALSDDAPNEGTFCIVAIFKNEGEVLNEWIQHYSNEGCSKFFMIDNGSNDMYQVNDEFKDRVEIVIDDTKHAQAQLYNKHFFATNKVKEYNWTMIVDLDEFVYSRKKFTKISDYLKSVQEPNVTQIAIPWKIFGSNGLNKPDIKEPESVIQGFTKRIDYDKDPEEGFQGVQETKADMKYDLVKCVARSTAIKSLGIHSNEMRYGRTVQSHDETTSMGTPFVPMNESRLKASPLQLNHYAIRSMDWYTRVKMTRGDADSADGAASKAKIDFFHNFDKVSNDIDDFELRDKTDRYTK